MALGAYWKRIGRRERYGVVVAAVCMIGLVWWGLAGNIGWAPVGWGWDKRALRMGRVWVRLPEMFPTRGEWIDGKPYLTREQTLGLALYSYYIEGDCGVNDNEDGMWSEPLRFVHPRYLEELRRMGSSTLPVKTSRGALILMLGQIGEESEVKLVEEALERYRGREIQNDGEGKDRLRAYEQAAIQLAKRNMPGARRLLEMLMDDAWWKELDVTYGGRQTKGEGEMMRTMAARAGIAWVEVAPERREKREDVQHRAKPGPSRYLERLEEQYRLHEGDVTRALGEAWDYEKGLLSTVPGKSRQ